MTPGSKNSIRLFEAFGITVFLHWSWFLVAAWQLERRGATRETFIWVAAEYLGLFALVLLHEFGHSLACRQVGGTAREIILWPLGGVAYVSPPPRPGAYLWSIAAGPLVNVALLPVFFGLDLLARGLGWPATAPATYELLSQLKLINFVLMVFNLLPIYPLDGGQIVRALLWFPLGRARSLTIASVIGVAGAAAFMAWALYERSLWIALLGFFALTRSWNGFRESRAMARIESWPRHEGYICPGCERHPPRAPLWTCGGCQERFDLFETGGACPACARSFGATACPECGQVHPTDQWKHRPPEQGGWSGE